MEKVLDSILIIVEAASATLERRRGKKMEGVRAGDKVAIPRSFFREALGLALEAVNARRQDRTGKDSSTPQAPIARWNRGRRSPAKKR